MFNRKSKKRIISLLAVMMMIFTMVPGMAFADDEGNDSVKQIYFSKPEALNRLMSQAAPGARYFGYVYVGFESNSGAVLTTSNVNDYLHIYSSNPEVIDSGIEGAITVSAVADNQDLLDKTKGQKLTLKFDKNAFKKPGTTKIVVKSVDGSVIAEKELILSTMTLSVSSLVLSPKGEADITVKYDNGIDSNNTKWESSNTNVATVDQNGHVTAVSEGICEIYAINGDDKVKCTVSCIEDGVYELNKGLTHNASAQLTSNDITKIDGEVVLDGPDASLNRLYFYVDGVRNDFNTHALTNGTYYRIYSDNTNVVTNTSLYAGENSFAGVADGTANLYVYIDHFEFVNSNSELKSELYAVIPVTVKNSGNGTAIDYRTEMKKVDSESQPGNMNGQLELKDYEYWYNGKNLAYVDNYLLTDKMGADAEFNLTVYDYSGTGRGYPLPDNYDEFIQNVKNELQSQIGEYVHVVDENGNDCNATVEIERVYIEDSNVNYDMKVTVKDLSVNENYGLIIERGLPRLYYNDKQNNVLYTYFESGVRYNFQTEKADLTKVTVSDIADQDYTGSEITPAIEVKDGDKVLAEGTDYTVEYTNNVEIGTATVTITAVEDSDYEGEVVKNFEIVAVPADSVTLDKSEATVTEGETVTLTAAVSPENTTDKTVTWTSSDEAVATVDANGVVTAVAAGTATITATCGDAAATCVVTVNAVVVPEDPEQPEEPADVEYAIEIDKETIVITDDMKAAGLDTEEAVVEYMYSLVTEEFGYKAGTENTVVWDVKLMISLDGGKTWVEATKENFPEEGITVLLPYPEGTNGEDYDFEVIHMFSTAMNGFEAGGYEIPYVTETEDGLVVTVYGLSPFAITWQEITADVPADTDSQDKDDVDVDTDDVVKPVDDSAQTGDESNMGSMFALMMAALLTAGAVFVRRREN